MNTSTLTHISTYRFVPLSPSELPSLRDILKEKLVAMQLKGSVLLSTEGFNLSLSGEPDDIDAVKRYFKTQPLFQALNFRESFAETAPFKRMIVKIKTEVIAFDKDQTAPVRRKPAPYIQPEELKQWYDEGRDMLLLDTRNNYEIQLGSFDTALQLNIRKFTDFKHALERLADEDRKRPVITFCTGGIRCEKAAPYLQELGFENVYQLEGGIINYFKKCGNAHYHGECFVFDRRVAINEKLEETATLQCWDCRSPLTEEDQRPFLQACPYCGSEVSYN